MESKQEKLDYITNEFKKLLDKYTHDIKEKDEIIKLLQVDKGHQFYFHQETHKKLDEAIKLLAEFVTSTPTDINGAFCPINQSQAKKAKQFLQGLK